MGKNAIILVDKPQGTTSFDCLKDVKKVINKKTGHCGTLDKFAHGLMIVLCGSYTKLVPLFMGMDKTYEALIEFGISTDTLDPEGEVIEKGSIPDFETVQNAVKKLVGSIEQVPPAYSAIHVNGKRCYKLARANEELPELKPRSIVIYDASIISYEAPFLRIRLHVSKGTYVRAYARDIGHLCESCAYVKELFRTQIGPFSVNDSIQSNDMRALNVIRDSIDGGLSLIGRLPDSEFIKVNNSDSFKLSNGNIPFHLKGFLAKKTKGFVVFEQENFGETQAVCIYSCTERKIVCQVKGE